MTIRNQARLIVVSIALTAIAPVARAQASAQASAQDSTSARRVPITIFAEASAREVTFRKQPSIHVTLNGQLDSVRVLDRRNLPSPVVVGTTYRDVYVAVEIFGRLTADCLAAQARGNTPRVDCASLDLRGVAAPPRR